MRLVIFLLLSWLLSINMQAGPIRDMLQKRSAQSSISTESKKMMDIAYGSDKRQRMDVYLPDNPKDAPIILMVHGGAWSMGDKRMSAVVKNKAARWNKKGVIFVSTNYRLLPDADLLAQADDVANALIYVQNNAASWGGATQKIILMGHSAGAHLVSLVSSDPSRFGKLKRWLATVSLDSAVMDVSMMMSGKHFNFYDEVFGADTAYWEQVSPYHRLSSLAIPTLMVCSTERPDKPCLQAEHFEQKAKTLGAHTEISSQALSHKEINDELGLESAYTRRVEEFISSFGIDLKL